MPILIYDCDHCGITYIKTNNEHDIEVCEVCGRTLTYKGERIDTKTLCNVRTLEGD